MTLTIEQAVKAHVVAAAAFLPTVEATFHYDARDPFAVRVDFPASATLEGTEVSWTFARELLRDGLTGPAGTGDVRVRPHGWERLIVEFHAPEGMAVVHLPSAEVRGFLERTAGVVAPGEERITVDLDRCLAALMREG